MNCKAPASRMPSQHLREAKFVVKKALLTVIALAVALAFAPALPLQAASPMGPGTRIHTDSVVDVVADKKGKKPAKKAKKKKGKKAKKGKKKAAGYKSCGTYMYYSPKAKKCLDKRG